MVPKLRKEKEHFVKIKKIKFLASSKNLKKVSFRKVKVVKNETG